MDRPGSRGAGMSNGGVSKAPTGSSVGMPDRPMTGQRGPGGGGGMGASGGGLLGQSQIGGFGPAGAAAGRAPGTAMRASGGSIGAPPGSAYKRLGTANGRPGTGSQGGANGARLGTAVTVDNRPITNHGVSGMRQKNTGGGSGRQVLDKAYFIGELRQKRLEIITVTQSMKVGAVQVGAAVERVPYNEGVSCAGWVLLTSRKLDQLCWHPFAHVHACWHRRRRNCRCRRRHRDGCRMGVRTWRRLLAQD